MNRTSITSLTVAAFISAGLLAGAPALHAAQQDGNKNTEVKRSAPVDQNGKRASAPAATAGPKNAVVNQSGQPLAKSKGALSFDFTSHDFGIHPAGAELDVRFPFTNTGTEPIYIESTKTSCGCTAAVVESREFAPGEGSFIDVTFKPTGTKRQTKNVTVRTNSITKPLITLAVIAEVVQVVDVSPNLLQFGESLIGEQKELFVTVFSKDENFSIEDIKINGTKGLLAELLDEIPAEVKSGFPGKRRIKITVPGTLDMGRIAASLQINTLAAFSEGENPHEQTEHKRTVQILGRIVGNLKASPTAIRMLPLRPKEDFSYTTRITHRGNQDFSINASDLTILRSSIPGVKTTVEPFEEGADKGFILTISGNSGNHRGAFRGTVSAHSSIEGEPPMRINFSGSVRPQR